MTYYASPPDGFPNWAARKFPVPQKSFRTLNCGKQNSGAFFERKRTTLLLHVTFQYIVSRREKNAAYAFIVYNELLSFSTLLKHTKPSIPVSLNSQTFSMCEWFLIQICLAEKLYSLFSLQISSRKVPHGCTKFKRNQRASLERTVCEYCNFHSIVNL